MPLLANSSILIPSAALAFALGFAAHKAGLCLVKAGAELANSGRMHLLFAFAKTSLWSLTVLLAGSWLLRGISYQAWPVGWLSLLGGLIFGMGAAINGGCVFSSLSRLADGKVAFLATVVGWPIGMALLHLEFPLAQSSPKLMLASHLDSYSEALPLLVLGLLLWVASQVWRIAKAWDRNESGQMTLSLAAAMIGLCNGIIYLNFQSWSVTSALARAVSGTSSGTPARSTEIWLLLLSAFLGMVTSSYRRGSFALQRARLTEISRHGLAGVAMGVGAGLIPGGNDALILYGVPFLSPHALPTLAAILTGIMLTFRLARLMGRQIPRITCSGDICQQAAT